MNIITNVFRYNPLKRDITLLDFRYFPWLHDQTHIYEWYLMTYDLNISCKVTKKKRNESDIKLNFQNLKSKKNTPMCGA